MNAIPPTDDFESLASLGVGSGYNATLYTHTFDFDRENEEFGFFIGEAWRREAELLGIVLDTRKVETRHLSIADEKLESEIRLSRQKLYCLTKWDRAGVVAATQAMCRTIAAKFGPGRIWANDGIALRRGRTDGSIPVVLLPDAETVVAPHVTLVVYYFHEHARGAS